MRYSDQDRLRHIKDLGSKLMRFLEDNDIDEQKLMDDQCLQWTVTTPLYNIGEHVYCLSSELKDQHPEIPWHKISGMQHRLIHDYADTNWSIVASTILKDVPAFLKQIETIDDPASNQQTASE